MIRDIDRDMWKPQRAKNFDSAIKHFIQSEFPRLGGSKVIDLFCCQIRKFIDQFYPKGEYVSFGQLPRAGLEPNPLGLKLPTPYLKNN